MTAEELIKILQTVPPDTPVGRMDNDGDLVDITDAYVTEQVTRYQTDKQHFLLSKHIPLERAVIITVEDIGNPYDD